jgi:2-amino-4-hydroxy-6-hydroxymethyldihydropteridine diphosphokinase
MALVHISLGSNVDREKHVKQGITALQRAFGELTLSSLFESEAVGFNGASFYNMVIALKTKLSIDALAKELRNIEFAYGRCQNAKKFSPRTLDLDILLFDDLIITKPAQLPRDEITKNAFVLWPLAEIAPELKHPILKQSYQQLWQAFDKNSQQLCKVPPCW